MPTQWTLLFFASSPIYVRALAASQLSKNVKTSQDFAMTCLKVYQKRGATEAETNKVLLVMLKSSHMILPATLESMQKALAIKENDGVHIAWEMFESEEAAKSFLKGCLEQHKSSGGGDPSSP